MTSPRTLLAIGLLCVPVIAAAQPECMTMEQDVRLADGTVERRANTMCRNADGEWEQVPLAAPEAAPQRASNMARSDDELLSDVGRLLENETINRIFKGEYSGGEGLGFRIVFRSYVKASDAHCGKVTPNGTTGAVTQVTPQFRDPWGTITEGKPYISNSYEVDILLLDKNLEYANSPLPGFTMSSAIAWKGTLENTGDDFERLFGIWECAGREIRQFQENLWRAAYGLPSLQAMRQRNAPGPSFTSVHQACEAYLNGAEPDPSGYRLSSCTCFADNAADALTADDIQKLSSRFDAMQVAIVAHVRNRPALLQTCIVADTRATDGGQAPGGTVAAADADLPPLLARNTTYGYEIRQPESGAWCVGTGARVDVFYDPSNSIAVDVSDRLDSFTLLYVIPVIMEHCPRAYRAAVSVYRYESTELMETVTYAWTPGGGVAMAENRDIPATVVRRNKAVPIPPPAPEERPSGIRLADLLPRGRSDSQQRRPWEEQQCIDAQAAIYDRVFAGDACAVSNAEIERAAAERNRVYQGRLCRALGQFPAEGMHYQAQQRCLVQREGGPTREEALLYQRLRERDGCRAIDEPAVVWHVDTIQKEVTRAQAQETLAGLRLLTPRTTDVISGAECLATHLLSVQSGVSLPEQEPLQEAAPDQSALERVGESLQPTSREREQIKERIKGALGRRLRDLLEDR